MNNAGLSKGRKVACPTCGEAAEYGPANPYRPFCSRRCQLIDLGQWAAENYRVPDTGTPRRPDEET